MINILTSIKEFQRNTFFAGVPQGGGAKFCIFFSNRDKTTTYKCKYFQINQRNSTKIFFVPGVSQGWEQFFPFFIVRDKTIKHEY